jgi:hypothetical protein
VKRERGRWWIRRGQVKRKERGGRKIYLFRKRRRQNRTERERGRRGGRQRVGEGRNVCFLQ